MFKENAEYNVAIVGFGIVGKGVYDIIKNSQAEMLDSIYVKYIYVREEKVKELQNKYDDVIFTSDINEIVEDEELDIVIECMGGVNDAEKIATLALKNQKDFITSNKALLAEKYNKLKDLADKNLSHIFYEASVGGGVHVFHSINDIKKVDSINAFIAVINGTTNYILSKMTNENKNFDEVLNEAKQQGFAEKDPSSDIDGLDAKYKLLIALNYIYDASYDLNDIINFGIRNIDKVDIDYATENDKVIKLVACGDSKNAFVIPMFIDCDDTIATVNSNLNVVEVYSEYLGKSTYIGQGAGSHPTAHSVVLDLCDLVNGNILYYNDYEEKRFENDIKGNFYIRTQDISKIKNKKSDIIENVVNENTIITKEIPLKELCHLVEGTLGTFVAKI